MCEAVDKLQEREGIEWAIPERPEEKCFVPPLSDDMTQDCVDQWRKLDEQCWFDADQPYQWTEDCDMLEQFFEGWFIWYGDDWDFDWDWDSWTVSLKRAFNQRRDYFSNRKAYKQTKQIALAKAAATTETQASSTGSDFATGTAYGAGIGLVGLLGAYVAYKACSTRAKTQQGDNFERLLQ